MFDVGQSRNCVAVSIVQHSCARDYAQLLQPILRVSVIVTLSLSLSLSLWAGVDI